MASGRAPKKLSQLWQGPLLVASLGLFGYSAWRFIDPKATTAGQRIQVARDLMNQERPEAALDYLNKLLNEGKIERPADEGAVHLLMAESIRQFQKQKHLNIALNHERIVQQGQIALKLGVKPTAAIEQMIGESYDALGRSADALACYRTAMGLDQGRSVGLQKKVIELQIESGDPTADATLVEYLANKDLSDSERAWALGERARIMISHGDYASAISLLKQALKPELDPVAQGQINYQLGYCTYTLGDPDQAERYLRLSREQLRVQHPLDADVCYLLGKIHEGRSEPEQAKSFYQVVLTSHPDAKIVPLALLGRGMCRLMLGENEPGMTDLHDLVGQINTRASRSKYRDDVIEGLKRASSILSAKEKYQDSLEAMAYEQELRNEPAGEFFARLGSVYEKRADQVERSPDQTGPAGQVRRQQQVRDLRSKAGDAYVAYSKALRAADDKGYGESLWRGIDLYDRAGDLPRAIAALELFVAERPGDSLTPDALLRLGRAYQAVGSFDKAVHAFIQNQLRYPKSLAASKSLVPLAQAYIARGPEMYAKAEEVLLSVVENNPLLSPDAEEFKQGLFELAQLYYRTQRYEEAVQRLDEWTRRYPKDERLSQMAFWMADSYRKSAALLDAKPQAGAVGANASASLADPAEIRAAKVERLTKARRYYDQVIELCKATPPDDEIGRLQLKLSHFYRADCMYDLGEFKDSITLYDAAALRYQDDPSALAAYVQIVNAYCAMGKPEEAKAANERVKWLLRRMPPESFEANRVSMPKDHWDQWLKWASASGMW